MEIIATQTHPLYQRLAPLWKFYRESHLGGEDYINAGHLFTHRLEGETDYRNRKQRAYYYNFCESIVDIYTSHLFKNSAARQSDDTDFYSFLTDVDQRGNSIHAFAKELAELTQIYGVAFIVVDKPRTMDAPSTRAEEIERGLLPYFCLVSPLDLLDWSIDVDGRLEWAKLRERAAVSVSPHESRSQTPTYHYRLWTRETWELYDDNGELLSAAPHFLGEVPIVPCYARKVGDMRGKSILSDIALVNRSIFNWCALLDEILYRQTFSQMVLQANDDHALEGVGTAQAIRYPRECQAPMFISPDPSQAAVLETRIERGIQEIFRMARLEGGAFNSRPESGLAKAFDFNRTNNLLSSLADNLEQAEIHMFRLWSTWQGKTWDGIIDYPDEFSVSSVNEDVERALALGRLQISETFDREMKKRIASKALPKISARLRENIEREIDDIAAGEDDKDKD